MKNSANLTGELQSMLDEMVEYPTPEVPSVERVVKRLVNVWLEYGMHRCRFILYMGPAHLRSVTEKVRAAEEGNLELTVVPGLRRHGDIRGVELASSTTVGGLQGEFVNLS